MAHNARIKQCVNWTYVPDLTSWALKRLWNISGHTLFSATFGYSLAFFPSRYSKYCFCLDWVIKGNPIACHLLNCQPTVFHFLLVQGRTLTWRVTYCSLFFFFAHLQTAKWIKSAAVLKHALGPGFTSVVPNGFVFSAGERLHMYMCLHAHAHGSVCMRILPFSLFHPLCRHNPSVYEIIRAHLCSGGSHLGSEEASTGNHLGSTQSSFHSASSVLSTLWPKLFILKGGGNQIPCVCVCICKVSQIKLLTTGLTPFLNAK